MANPSLVLAGRFARLGVAVTALAAAFSSPAGGTLRPLRARRSASPPPTTAGTSPPRRSPAFPRTARCWRRGTEPGAPPPLGGGASKHRCGAGARCQGSRSALWSDAAASCPGSPGVRAGSTSAGARVQSSRWCSITTALCRALPAGGPRLDRIRRLASPVKGAASLGKGAAALGRPRPLGTPLVASGCAASAAMRARRRESAPWPPHRGPREAAPSRRSRCWRKGGRDGSSPRSWSTARDG